MIGSVKQAHKHDILSLWIFDSKLLLRLALSHSFSWELPGLLPVI